MLVDSSYLRDWDEGPWVGATANHAVEEVSWFAAYAYCLWAGGRLPKEEEWEKACRAGSITKFHFGDDDKRLGDYAWYNKNSDYTKTNPVGRKRPNAWGLYDMYGNVEEWCSSLYVSGSKWYEAGARREDPDDTESRRTVRGGSRSGSSYSCSSSRRSGKAPNDCGRALGFRLCVPAR